MSHYGRAALRRLWSLTAFRTVNESVSAIQRGTIRLRRANAKHVVRSCAATHSYGRLRTLIFALTLTAAADVLHVHERGFALKSSSNRLEHGAAA